ncbi:MAG TPA: hypothetical protein VFZ97_10985 [Acidimicrobiales bacterium]
MDFLSDFRGRQAPNAASAEPIAALPAPSPQPSVPVVPVPSAPVVSPPLNGKRIRESSPPSQPEFYATDEATAMPQLDFPPPELPKDHSKDWVRVVLAHSWVQRARSVVERWQSWEQDSRSGVENPRATGSMILGLFSLFLPVLAVPSIVLGVRSLRYLSVQPWRKGRLQSIVGISASAVLAPISVAVWFWIYLT